MGGFHFIVHKLFEMIVFYLMLLQLCGIVSLRCRTEPLCSCSPSIINCDRSRLTDIPLFNYDESANVVHLTLVGNFISQIQNIPVKKHWINLKVKYISHFVRNVKSEICVYIQLCSFYFSRQLTLKTIP